MHSSGCNRYGYAKKMALRHRRGALKINKPNRSILPDEQ
jgi:hypothetical protein